MTYSHLHKTLQVRVACEHVCTYLECGVGACSLTRPRAAGATLANKIG